jgi:transcriptional regulator
MSRRGSVNLLQGTLDLLVLKAMTFGPIHGYGVARWVRDTTSGTLNVDDGALYPALHRLEKRGWVRSEWGVTEENRRAKYYVLTRSGRKQMEVQADAWTRYADAVSACLGAAEGAS